VNGTGGFPSRRSAKRETWDKEHSTIADTVINRDAALSVKLVTSHMRLTTEILQEGAFAKKQDGHSA
jgi:DNA-binding GntR family transcriptional regulator